MGCGPWHDWGRMGGWSDDSRVQNCHNLEHEDMVMMHNFLIKTLVGIEK